MSTEPLKLPKAGDQVHFLESGHMIPAPGGSGAISHSMRRGQTITLTSDLIEAARDREGNPGWPASVYDPACEWVQPGPAPQGMSPWSPGDPEEVEERERRRKAAWAETDDERRRNALQAVVDEFGPATPTSRTLNAAASAALRPSGRVSR